MKQETTTYKLKDGDTIVATSPTDFVTQLREGSRFDSDGTDQEYMYRFAHRCEVQTGALIRTDSPENFMQDLLDTGYIEENDNSL